MFVCSGKQIGRVGFVDQKISRRFSEKTQESFLCTGNETTFQKFRRVMILVAVTQRNRGFLSILCGFEYGSETVSSALFGVFCRAEVPNLKSMKTTCQYHYGIVFKNVWDDSVKV